MKQKYSIPAIALAATFAVSTLGLAADYGAPSNSNNSTSNAPAATSPNAVAPDQNQAPAPTLSGTVQKVDTKNQNVQIKDSTGSLQIVKVDTSTEIRRDGQVIQLAELHKGDNVSIKNATPAAM